MPKSIVGLEWDHQRWAALLKLSKRVAKVDCKKAKSRNPEDKRKIDQYVKDGIGFAELNKKVKRAILRLEDDVVEKLPVKASKPLVPAPFKLVRVPVRFKLVER